MIKTFKKCPNCEKGILDIRIKRSVMVKYIFTWIGNKRYQCNACGIKLYSQGKDT